MSKRVPGHIRSKVISDIVRGDVRRASGRLAGLFVLCVASLGATAEGAMADYRDTVLGDLPSSYFRMDDANATMVNEVAAAPNGSHENDPFLGAVGALPNETTNRAVAYFPHPAPDRSRFTVGSYDEFSLEFFVWTEQAAPTPATQWYEGFGLVDGEVSGESDDAGTALIANGSVGFGMGKPDKTIASTTAINDGSWHHVVATHNGLGVMKLYVDGDLEAQENNGPPAARTNNDFTVGSLHTNISEFNGLIDEVAFYRSALSANDVVEHYAAARDIVVIIYVDGGGEGDVLGSDGLACGPSHPDGECVGFSPPGSINDYVASEAVGSRFGGFSGPDCLPTSADHCEVVVDSPTGEFVGATFSSWARPSISSPAAR